MISIKTFKARCISITFYNIIYFILHFINKKDDISIALIIFIITAFLHRHTVSFAYLSNKSYWKILNQIKYNLINFKLYLVYITSSLFIYILYNCLNIVSAYALISLGLIILYFSLTLSKYFPISSLVIILSDGSVLLSLALAVNHGVSK